ncbi:MAG TPA: 30S ribosomal protein S8 [Phycisphaerae bacterium]|jgi:small subunit ribosomal protein S8|nr:30S ribosomal protein S8 [Phycisphaerae bacterium]
MSDTIADMLTRLRNAAAAKHKTVDVKNSKICQGIARVLKEEGYVDDFSVLDDGTKQGLIRLTIRYTPTGEQVLREVKRISKPGCRVYRSVKDLPRVIQGLGVVVLSTSKGVLSDRQARQQNIGGELLATVS